MRRAAWTSTMRTRTLLLCALAWCSIAVVPVFGIPPAEHTPGLVDIDFRGADIRSALTGLAEMAGMNIVIEGTVHGRTSVRLKQVTAFDAIKAIASVHDLRVVIENGIILVTPNE